MRDPWLDSHCIMIDFHASSYLGLCQSYKDVVDFLVLRRRVMKM